MTAKELAEILSGREVGNEIGGPVAQWAKDASLVVVYGYSDDNVEFSGAIDDEVGAYEGATILLPAGRSRRTSPTRPSPSWRTANRGASGWCSA